MTDFEISCVQVLGLVFVPLCLLYGLNVAALCCERTFLRPDRVALRAIRRTAKRIRKIGERIACIEQQIVYWSNGGGPTVGRPSAIFAIANDVRPTLIEETKAWRRVYTGPRISSAKKDISELRAQLAAEIENWKKRVDDYHEFCPPSVPEEKATYRVAPPKVRVELVIEETEELLAHLAPQALAADS